MAFNMPQGPPQPGFVPPNTEMAMSNEEASAPPLHELSVPFGYENASFTAAVLPPPLPPVDSYNAANVQRAIPNLAVVREEEIRSALDDFLSDHCCYGSKPAKDLQIRDIIMRSSFQLTISHKLFSRTNHVDDYVSDETGLSEDLIKNATGSVAFDERYPQVYPLNNFPDERISRASKGLIQKHHTSFTMERILEQRHKVMLIPVAVVYYKWEQKDGCFYVYGLEHKVCFDDYPQQCCWGVCTIL
ncbi:hypothetical protein B4U80_04765 [Leptotrombidium deliense]|uniref:Uncharacterized protein n=1 Tax=Leptotrombidium deliense TaxID=299467 RepID=A0A443SPW0_9ACAR|nr:hypothetical protein B4U80_04765 [Leptotrombidium deliense]